MQHSARCCRQGIKERSRGNPSGHSKWADHFAEGTAGTWGVTPSGQIEVTAPPDGRIEIKAARPAGTINEFIGLLAGKTQRTAIIEELTEMTTRPWAGRE